MVLVLLGPLARPAPAATAVDSVFSSLVNGLRSTLGLAPLTVDPGLSDVALAWSAHMARTGVMAHNGALTSQVQGWSKLAENVGFGRDATQIFNGLAVSPVHLRNMSDPEFTRIGVGSATDGQGRLWTTHVFMRPTNAAAAPAPRLPAVAPVPRASAPTSTRASRPAPTIAVASAAPAPTAAPAPPAPPVPTAEPARPAPVETAGGASSTDGTPVLASATSAPERPVPGPLLAVAALLLLLVLAGAGLVHRSASSRRHPPAAAPGEKPARGLDLGGVPR